LSPARRATDRDAPIGVFDSGIGGLSVLNALRATLPGEDFVYLADSAHAPYGERDDAFISARSIAIATHLRDAHRAKLLAIACNTASAAAVQALRSANPDWPIVAIEPALKPAARLTRSGRVGVLATRGTLASASFRALHRRVTEAQPQVRFQTVACDGLAAAIEQWAISGDDTAAGALLDRYLGALLAPSDDGGPIDSLVLGCTHYPLLHPQIAQRLGCETLLIDAGPPVARQAERLLRAAGLLRATGDDVQLPPGRLQLATTGSTADLHAAARRCLQAPAGTGAAANDFSVAALA